MSQPDPRAFNHLSLEYLESLSRESRDFQSGWQELAKLGSAAVPAGPTFQRRSIFASVTTNGHPLPVSAPAHAQNRLDQLIHAFRVRGHRAAMLNPLEQQRPIPPELDPKSYGFTEEDMDREYSSDDVFPGMATSLRRIVTRLQRTYCHHIGMEFMHMDDLEARRWLQQRMERSENHTQLGHDEQIRVLTHLTDAVIFEDFLQKRFVGAKVFSLEGAESLIPLLASAINRAGEQGIDEIVFGMAHRGRLNVLANIIGKRPRDIFREFEDARRNELLGRGDVKYHLGYSSDWLSPTGKRIHLSLCFNPSHLEYVNPVAIGRVRAKQDRAGDIDRKHKLAILIHGDASLAGEGIVQETLNLSRLGGYEIGGTLHIVVNNQIGFTTPPSEGRSTTYATDVAKMLRLPIFHVNGEDPEAVAQSLSLAMQFRQKFRRDAFIDMYCYRLHGHNETDEPSFTQPRMYQAIRSRDSIQQRYLDNVTKLGTIDREEAERIAEGRRHHLHRELSLTQSEDYEPLRSAPVGVWQGYQGGSYAAAPSVETGVDRNTLRDLLEKLTSFPEGFSVHRTIELGLKRRRKMMDGEAPVDWSTAEALALASLAFEAITIRMSGQDTQRGTFSQRHAVLHDTKTGDTYMPLAHLHSGLAPVEIINSPLSEQGVLGFEYGYSLDQPGALVVWEAQFGDFINAAQVIIDQFLVSAEDKWNRLSGLVLLLPHGFEGMGPEHSSARLERFLTLAAEDNIQVTVPSTPAQYFHLLRRQALWRWRKPLIILTPKSLLRHKAAVSTLEDLADGSFRPVLADTSTKGSVSRVLLCAGKVYYELADYRAQHQLEDVAIVRWEQLYPIDEVALREAFANVSEETPIYWVQEEPWNMGAWPSLRVRFGDRLLGRWQLRCISRPESASPATGSPGSHKLEQSRIIEAAFAS